MIKGIERIEDKGELLALIARSYFKANNLDFITENHHSFQIGFHNKKKGSRARAHFSLPFKELKNLIPNKIYYVKNGNIGVDIYDNNNKKVIYVTLNEGDLIVFISGAHGVDFLKDSEVIEIKQGPYRGVDIEKKFIEK